MTGHNLPTYKPREKTETDTDINTTIKIEAH
jgi:hypothetical protein